MSPVRSCQAVLASSREQAQTVFSNQANDRRCGAAASDGFPHEDNSKDYRHRKFQENVIGPEGCSGGFVVVERNVDQSDGKAKDSEDNSGGRVFAPTPPYSELFSRFRDLESAPEKCGGNETTFHYLHKAKLAMITAHASMPERQILCGSNGGGGTIHHRCDLYRFF